SGYRCAGEAQLFCGLSRIRAEALRSLQVLALQPLLNVGKMSRIRITIPAQLRKKNVRIHVLLRLGGGKIQPPSITVYRKDARGDIAPLRVIQGSKTLLDWPTSIAVHPDRGELFVANDTDDIMTD